MSNILSSVRRITLLLFTLTICAGFLIGKINAGEFMAAGLVVIGFYFGQKAPAPAGEETVAKPQA